jgi:hypothetical protein
MKIIKIDKYFGKQDKEISLQEYLDTGLSPNRWDEADNSIDCVVKLKQRFINLSELLIEKGILDIREYHNRVVGDEPQNLCYFKFEQ